MSALIEQRLSRYRAWRLREPVDRPMVGLIWEPDIPPLPEFLEWVGAGREVQPDQIQPEMFLPYVERWYERDCQLISDVIQRFTPAFGIPWVEAVAGCRVTANPGSLWAEPCLDRYDDRPKIRFDPNNPWVRKLVEFTRVMVECADDRFPIAVPQMRGPLDTLAAMRTPEQMCIDLIERPEDVYGLLGELTDLWIGIGQAVLDVIPPFHGGYMARMGTWAPGPAITPQNDVCTLVSPQLYEQLVLPWDRKIVDHFQYTEFHMHGSEHHQVDNVLTLDKLTTIEFTLEHTLGGPPLATTLPVARRILQSKPLLLAAMDVETAEQCLTELPRKGLCMTIALNDDQIPRHIARWLEEHCR